MRSNIVSEGGEFERTLLADFFERTLPGLNIRVIAGGGKWNTVSLARTLLLDLREPTALVVDADTVNENLIAEQKRELENSLSMVAEPALWTVALCEPEIERVFFRNISFVEALLGKQLTDIDKALSEYDPRRVLKQIEPNYKHTLPAKWRGRDLSPLKEDPALAGVYDFLDAHHRQAAA